jgi:hypothetical protein
MYLSIYVCMYVASQVELRHVESLWETLSDMASCDPFAKVHVAYKDTLSARWLPTYLTTD